MYEPSPIVAKLYSVCTVSQASSVLAESHALTTSEPVHVVRADIILSHVDFRDGVVLLADEPEC